MEDQCACQPYGFVTVVSTLDCGPYNEVMKIYLIEDDVALRNELCRILGFQGYQVDVCEDFSRAASLALASDSHLVIMDLRLPGADGLDICREFRRNSQAPVLILTSSDSEFDEITGLHLGADDYLTKPYSPAVLLAHVERLLQRANPQGNTGISYKGITVDAARSEVSFASATAELSRNELRILSALIHAHGAIVSRQELMYELWQSDEFIDDNTLTVNVNRLRKLLQRLGVPDDTLKTHRGQGYSL